LLEYINQEWGKSAAFPQTCDLVDKGKTIENLILEVGKYDCDTGILKLLGQNYEPGYKWP